tara:strand:+ start:4962 stop:5363 length:402 start_codon:yes stop_codon:yes gene_type:complete
MNGLILLIIILVIYRVIIEYIELETKTKYYFYGITGLYSIYLILYYFYPEYVYKMFKEIYETNKKPLYDIQPLMPIRKQISHKELLHSKQGGRCYNCINFILGNEVDSCSIDVDENNKMKLLCPKCYNKERYY